MCLVCLRKLFQHCFPMLWQCSSMSLEECSAERMKITCVENREFSFLHSTRAERCLHLCLTPCGGQFVCKLGQNGPATQDQAQLCRMIPSSPRTVVTEQSCKWVFAVKTDKYFYCLCVQSGEELCVGLVLALLLPPPPPLHKRNE